MESWPKDVAIVRMKSVPKFNVTFFFCEVSVVNEGVAVVLKVFVVSPHVFFASHLASGRVFDETV
jgi:hypothetical protein